MTDQKSSVDPSNYDQFCDWIMQPDVEQRARPNDQPLINNSRKETSDEAS